LTTDSFFTSRNHFDAQLEEIGWSAGSCDAMIEACARRMSRLDGPHAAAARIQRVADICAGVHNPAFDFRHIEASLTPAPAGAKPAVKEPWWRRSLFASFAFWLGLFLGLPT
jgi:hypothetical protein